MFEEYSDGDLIRMARKGSREARAELWDRADTDSEYRGLSDLAATLQYHRIERPGAERSMADNALTDRYRKRWT